MLEDVRRALLGLVVIQNVRKPFSVVVYIFQRLFCWVRVEGFFITKASRCG